MTRLQAFGVPAGVVQSCSNLNEILTELLGMDRAEVDRLIGEGALR